MHTNAHSLLFLLSTLLNMYYYHLALVADTMKILDGFATHNESGSHRSHSVTRSEEIRSSACQHISQHIPRSSSLQWRSSSIPFPLVSSSEKIEETLACGGDEATYIPPPHLPLGKSDTYAESKIHSLPKSPITVIITDTDDVDSDPPFLSSCTLRPASAPAATAHAMPFLSVDGALQSLSTETTPPSIRYSALYAATAKIGRAHV